MEYIRNKFGEFSFDNSEEKDEFINIFPEILESIERNPESVNLFKKKTKDRFIEVRRTNAAGTSFDFTVHRIGSYVLTQSMTFSTLEEVKNFLKTELEKRGQDLNYYKSQKEVK